MEIENISIKELLSEISSAVTGLTTLMATVDEHKVNTVPYDGSWTAPQLLNHVTKSINGMAKAMQADSVPANRNPAERVEELRKIFLDFSQKFQSPAFIVPDDDIYEQSLTIDQLNEAFEGFKKSATTANLEELIEGLPLGPITKLETIYFTLFHTQRHLHQLKKICEALKTK